MGVKNWMLDFSEGGGLATPLVFGLDLEVQHLEREVTWK
jgi:hypothetical protein